MIITILHQVQEPYVNEETGSTCPQWEVEINGERFYHTENEIVELMRAQPIVA